MTNRRNVPKAVETEVLIRCARRCCICYGLTFPRKSGHEDKANKSCIIPLSEGEG
jgi:hypothetical protein